MVGRSAGVGGRTAVLVSALLAVGGLLPPATAAVDPDATQVLPGTTLMAVTVDLDDDGTAEVVRLLHEPGPGVTVDAWSFEGERWTRVGAAELLPPLAGGSEQLIPDMEIAALLLWKLEGRDRVLALTAAVDPSSAFGRNCCFAISEVRHRDAGIVLEAMEGAGGAAQFVQAVDLDGDGTDELLMQETTYEDDQDQGTFRLQALRWGEAGFETIFETEEPGQGIGMMAADTDGVTGDELLIGPSERGDLKRLAWIDGEIRLDEAHLDLGEQFGGWVAGAAGGSIVVVDSEGLRVIRWPRGGALSTVARIDSLTFPTIAVIGEGPEALIVTQDGFDFAGAGAGEPTTTVYDLDLRALGELGVAPGTESVWDLVNDRSQSGIFNMQRSVFPYVGPIPGGIDGRPAYLASGILIQPDGAGSFVSRTMAALIGIQPVGLAGPQGSWVALGDGLIGAIAAASLFGIGGGPFGSGQLALTPLDELLLPDAEAEWTSIELRNAVEVSRDGNLATLLAAGDGFEAIVTGPPNSEVIVGSGSQFETHQIADEPLLLEIGPPRNRQDDENQDFERLILVITPDGRGSLVRWQGTFVREPPSLVAQASTEVFGLRSTITGRSSSGATVTVDGQSAELSQYGAFRVDVDAPIWPRDVIMVAQDPLGNETVSRIQVVGFLDYRGLPWGAILGVATLAAGAFLFVHTPRRREEPSMTWGDAALEEIDGD